MAGKIPQQPSTILKNLPWLPVMFAKQDISPRYSKRTFLIGLFLGIIFISALAYIQFSTPNLVGNDGYYHIKFAQLMRFDGLKPEFTWLPLTILNQREFSDHHFLYHVLLIPFTYSDLLVGAKWASVIFASLAFLSVWWLLYNQKVPYAALWTLGLLAVSGAFLYRMNIGRALSLSLAVLVLGLHWMLTGKYLRLIPLAFLYVWLYDGFPFLLILAFVYLVGSWLAERRFEWRPLVYVGVGIALGLIFNPYFPHRIIFVVRHIFPKLSDTTSVRVGSEWYPYRTSQLLENSTLAMVAFISGALALGLSGRRMRARTAVSFLAAVVFGVMLFQSRRFVEYFPAFALIFAAFAWSPIMLVSVRDQQSNETKLQAASSKLSIGSWVSSFKNWLPALVLVLVLLPGLWAALNDARSSVMDSSSYERYAGASAWLESNTPEGTHVFQTDWDDFTRLFFYNTHNTYLVGLDPTYLQLYDPKLYDLWVDITEGDVEQPSDYIYSSFASEYVLTDLNHKDFIRRAESDPGLAEVYRDQDAIIYRVLP